jgi:LmbE family N-acetylglucosaminyl deacetylase
MQSRKTILVVSAHPDDDVLGCGGVIAKHASFGDKVHLIFMTNGISARDTALEIDISNRQISTQKAAHILGIESMQQFDFPDNKMDTVPLLDVVQSIEGVVSRLQPEIIYTHHIGDLNVDHQVVHKAVMTSCRSQPGFCVKSIYAFEVLSSTEWQTPGYLPFTPNVFIDISNQIQIKRKALKVYNQEMRPMPHTRNIDNVIRLNALRGNTVGVDYAEAFMLLRSMQ